MVHYAIELIKLFLRRQTRMWEKALRKFFEFRETVRPTNGFRATPFHPFSENRLHQRDIFHNFPVDLDCSEAFLSHLWCSSTRIHLRPLQVPIFARVIELFRLLLSYFIISLFNEKYLTTSLYNLVIWITKTLIKSFMARLTNSVTGTNERLVIDNRKCIFSEDWRIAFVIFHC